MTTWRSEPRELAYCEECKRELYEGDTVYKVMWTDKYYCCDCIAQEVLEDDY